MRLLGNLRPAYLSASGPVLTRPTSRLADDHERRGRTRNRRRPFPADPAERSPDGRRRSLPIVAAALELPIHRPSDEEGGAGDGYLGLHQLPRDSRSVPNVVAHNLRAVRCQSTTR